MTRQSTDTAKLRAALRRMRRGQLLLVAERAIELVPRTKLRQLVGDLLRFDELTGGTQGAAPLLQEVRDFHEASLRGEFYESFPVNWRNCMERSKGTDAFMAEFDRLLDRCVRASEEEPRSTVGEAFELLFALLRRLDQDPDSVVFFADEGGSWQVGVHWGVVLPAYFRCLADGASGEEFARAVDRVIRDFERRERPVHLAAARRVANAEQKAALRRLTPRDREG